MSRTQNRFGDRLLMALVFLFLQRFITTGIAGTGLK